MVRKEVKERYENKKEQTRPIRVRGLRACDGSVADYGASCDDSYHSSVRNGRTRWHITHIRTTEMSDLEEAARWYCDHEITAAGGTGDEGQQ